MFQRNWRSLGYWLIPIVMLSGWVSSPAAQASFYYDVVQVTSESYSCASPRINNAGEIVWWRSGGGVFSNLRGFIGTGFYPSISNAGEVVWYDSVAGGKDIFSSTRGRLTFGANVYYQSPPDVNSSGEVVYSMSDGAHIQIWSTVQGQITSDPTDHYWPSINDLGEIIWSQDVGGTWLTVSTTRGHLPYYGGNLDLNNNGEISYTSSYLGSAPHVFSSVHGVVIPDSGKFQWGSGINDAGQIVFYTYPSQGADFQVYLATPVPEPAALSLLAAAGLALLKRKRKS